MATDLELVDYDVEGAARVNGVIVDGAAVVTKVRRLAVVTPDPTLPVPLDANGKPRVVVDENGVALRQVTPPGPVTSVRVPLSGSPQKAAILAAFQALEDLMLAISVSQYDADAASPEALDEKILAATEAVARKEAVEKELAVVDADLAAKLAEAAELDARIAAKLAEVAAMEAMEASVEVKP